MLISNTPPLSASFRFYEELNDFLPLEKRKQDLTYTFFGKPSIKDAIEAQGVPHTEVDLITANGFSVGFDYHLGDGDRIAVYPYPGPQASAIAHHYSWLPAPFHECRRAT
jgi:hypothetical protein